MVLGSKFGMVDSTGVGVDGAICVGDSGSDGLGGGYGGKELQGLTHVTLFPSRGQREALFSGSGTQRRLYNLSDEENRL